MNRFLAEAPVAVLARAALAHLFADTTLDALFQRVAVTPYTRQRTFSTLVRLMPKVVFTAQPSVHAASRWQIETAFQELTENLRCEINTLGYPRAALFGFALAMTAYNLLVFLRQALARGSVCPFAEERERAADRPVEQTQTQHLPGVAALMG